MRRVEIEYGDIGELARFKRPDLAIQAHRLCGIDRRHFNATLGWHDGRIEMLDSLQERASLHLFDHVDRVINHRAVRTERDVHAGRECGGRGTNAAAPHRLTGWAINETSSAV